MVLGPFLLAIGAPLACAPDASPVQAGGECFIASDCAPGLVCVPQRGGARQCSSDLSQVVGRPPPEAGGGEAAPPVDGAPPDDSGEVQDTSVPDTSKPDTSTPPPVDAGDAG